MKLDKLNSLGFDIKLNFKSSRLNNNERNL